HAMATAQGRTGTLTLGLCSGMISSPVREGLASFITTSPGIRLKVIERPPLDLHRHLDERAIDMAITMRVPDLPVSNQVAREDLWEDPWLIALPADHALAHQAELPW